MKKIFKALKLIGAIAFLVLTFIACDKDFNSIDSDVLGKENSNFSTNKLDITPLAYNKKLENVQVNGLNSSLLGFYEDPLYGTTTASIVTQITPTTFDPDFGTNPVIDSVVLRMPYFSTAIGVDENNITTYRLDSLYGNIENPIKLSIYQSNYLLRDFNPTGEPNSPQNYFSKAEIDLANPTHNFVFSNGTIVDFDQQIIGNALFEKLDFKPDSLATVTKTGAGDDEVVTQSTPSFREKLDNDFWKSVIIDKEGDPVLSNANNFRNYFRGLYIKAEAASAAGNMVLLNLTSADANITIHYTNGETDSRVQASYSLNFNGNRLNTFINDFSFNGIPLTDGDNIQGDEKLLLKGTAAGSMAIIDLFANDDLQTIKDEFIVDGNATRLINEARLTIFEDEQNIPSDSDTHKYDRIYVYDLTNNSSTIDYTIDPTENTAFPLASKVVSLGQRDTINVNGIERMGYKIRITEYIKNIVLRDSTNTKLGLVISNNVNYIANAEISNNSDLQQIPAATIITPRGTVLNGSNDNLDADLQMKLEIFYTEPNN